MATKSSRLRITSEALGDRRSTKRGADPQVVLAACFEHQASNSRASIPPRPACTKCSSSLAGGDAEGTRSHETSLGSSPGSGFVQHATSRAFVIGSDAAAPLHVDRRRSAVSASQGAGRRAWVAPVRSFRSYRPRLASMLPAIDAALERDVTCAMVSHRARGLRRRKTPTSRCASALKEPEAWPRLLLDGDPAKPHARLATRSRGSCAASRKRVRGAAAPISTRMSPPFAAADRRRFIRVEVPDGNSHRRRYGGRRRRSLSCPSERLVQQDPAVPFRYGPFLVHSGKEFRRRQSARPTQYITDDTNARSACANSCATALDAELKRTRALEAVCVPNRETAGKMLRCTAGAKSETSSIPDPDQIWRAP